MIQDEVILVNEQDEVIGVATKSEAHEKGLLHRAFSILIFNSKGELLLQQRAFHKYHSAGLWTNSCCSHPRPGETIGEAAHRRLQEEMGFDCALEPQFSFIYHVQLQNGLYEHEFDHVLSGVFSGEPRINSNEAAAFRWIVPQVLREEIAATPGLFTYWLKAILQQMSL